MFIHLYKFYMFNILSLSDLCKQNNILVTFFAKRICEINDIDIIRVNKLLTGINFTEEGAEEFDL